MFGLVDANNFFVSCERVFNPVLENKPVVVLSNNDGCIISRSNEAKALGIPMGVPLFKVRPLIKQHHITFLSSNFVLYGDLSNRMMSFIKELIPDFEVYSIDEAFINLQGFESPFHVAQILRDRIYKWIGIPVSIGLAPTKTLAKVASHIAKKSLQRIHLLNDGEIIDRALSDFPVEDIWGIGGQLSKALKSRGIYTALDLKRKDPRWMRQKFTVVGERTLRELNGFSCLEVGGSEPNRKSIRVSRALSKPADNKDSILKVMSTHAQRVSEKLIKHQKCARELYLFMDAYRFTEKRLRHHKMVVLESPLQDVFNLTKVIVQEIQKIFREGVPYKRAGIVALGLIPENQHQGGLFGGDHTLDFAKHKQLSKVMTSLNGRFGKRIIKLGSCGVEANVIPAPQFKSPPYTTAWGGLVWVR